MAAAEPSPQPLPSCTSGRAGANRPGRSTTGRGPAGSGGGGDRTPGAGGSWRRPRSAREPDRLPWPDPLASPTQQRQARRQLAVAAGSAAGPALGTAGGARFPRHRPGPGRSGGAPGAQGRCCPDRAWGRLAGGAQPGGDCQPHPDPTALGTAEAGIGPGLGLWTSEQPDRSGDGAVQRWPAAV